jgi:hypothetical protein
MPNWCDCDLVIKSTKRAVEELKRFVEYAKDGEDPISTERFVSYPECFRKLDEIVHGIGLYLKELRSRLSNMSDEEFVKRFPYPPFPDGYNLGGYDWAIENWGSKWGICDARIIEENYDRGRVVYNFLSPWSPPLPVILKMSEMFPKLTFTLRYYECGMGFQGLFRARGGKVMVDKCWKYNGNRGG